MKDYTGKKYGKLTAVKFAKRAKNRTYWEYICDCGKSGVYMVSNVTKKNGKSSCGCGLIGRKYNTKDTARNTGRIYKDYKKSAAERGHSFDISKSFFDEIIAQKCFYCGIEPMQKIDKKGLHLYNGIDRKNNNIGYTNENCLPCCGICNRAKRELDYYAFIEWIKRISENFKKELL